MFTRSFKGFDLKMNGRIQKSLFIFYVVIIGLFYGLMLAGQLLGFMGGYRSVPAILTSVLAGAGAVWAYFHWEGWHFYDSIFERHADQGRSRYLNVLLYAASLIVILFLFVLPLVRWPYSPIGDNLTWDAGLYHFPKAIDLYRTGSFWDLGVPYGEYPIGYESLLSFGLVITQNEMLFGVVHALIAMYFTLTVWLLACRYTRLSPPLLFFVTSLLMLSGSIPVESNLWWILYHLINTIGKNDLLLSAAVLSVILHAPVGISRSENRFHELGVILVTMIAIAVKPNAIFLVVPVWLVILWNWWRKSYRDGNSGPVFFWKRLLAAGALISPGILWLVRNYWVTGRFFSDTASTVQTWSILSNIRNPYLYQYLPRNFIILGLLVGILFILAVWKSRPSRSMTAILFILFLKFIASPASAFSGDTMVPAQIAWRFAADFLAYVFVLLVVIVEPLIQRWYDAIRKHVLGNVLIIGVVIAVCSGLIWYQSGSLRYIPANGIVLRDQFREKVGKGSYYSAYDYLRRNIRDSVVWVENGLPYYAFGQGFTNSISRSEKAEYTLVFQTAWFGGDEAYPEIVETSEWRGNWILIYEDSQGRVYRRK